MKKVTSLLLLTGVAAFGLVGCGDDVVTQPDDPQVLSVTVTPSSVTIEEGETVTLAANVEAEEGADTGVTWSSSNSGVASVDGNGNVTGISTGSATIVATSNADPSKSGAAEVTVTQAGGDRPTVSIQAVFGGPDVPENIKGELTVNVNVDEGDQDISALQLLLTDEAGNTVVAREQTFSTNTISGLSTDTEGTSVIQFDIDTARPDEECTIGQQLAAAFENGDYTLQARLILESGDDETATWDDTLSFNNGNVIKIIHIAGTGNDVVGNGERYWSENYEVAADVDANGDGVLDRELQFAACPLVFEGDLDVAEIAINGETTSSGDDKDLSVNFGDGHGAKTNDNAEPWQYAAPAAINDSVEDNPGSAGHVIGDDVMVMDAEGLDVTDEFTVEELEEFFLDFTAPMDDPTDDGDPRIQIEAMDIMDGHYTDKLAFELPDGTFLGDESVDSPVSDYSVVGLMDGGVGMDPAAQPVDVYHDTADVNNGMPLAQDLDGVNDAFSDTCVVPDTTGGDDFCLEEQGPAVADPAWYVSQTPRIVDLLGNFDDISSMDAAEATDNNFDLLRRSDVYGVDRTAPDVAKTDTTPVPGKVIDDVELIFTAADPNLDNEQDEAGAGVDDTDCGTTCSSIHAFDSDGDELAVDNNGDGTNDEYRVNFGTGLDDNEGMSVTIETFVPDFGIKAPNVSTLAWTFIYDTEPPRVGFAGVTGLDQSDADFVDFTVDGSVTDRNDDGTAVTSAILTVSLAGADGVCNTGDDVTDPATHMVSPPVDTVTAEVQANGGEYSSVFTAENLGGTDNEVRYCFNMTADDGAMTADGADAGHEQTRSAGKDFTWNPTM